MVFLSLLNDFEGNSSAKLKAAEKTGKQMSKSNQVFCFVQS